MERRFFYPGSAESRFPTSDVVYRTSDLEDRSLPYRELRANDHGYLQRPPPSSHKVTTDVYSAQPPMTRGGHSGAVPWWTSIGLGLRPADGISRSRDLRLLDENLESKLSKYYDEDGLVNDSGRPLDKNNSKLIKKTTEPQLWRKICEPKRAILTEDNGKLVWRETDDAYNKTSKTITQTVEVQQQPSRLRSSMLVGRAPYMVYT